VRAQDQSLWFFPVFHRPFLSPCVSPFKKRLQFLV